MGSGSLLALLCFCIFLATGCATPRHDFEEPSVSVTSFTPLPSEGLAPRFEIGLRVVNPNPESLSLRGMSYKLFLNDYEVLDGAANGLPVVPAYGEAEFKVVASVGLIAGIRFVNDMLQNARDLIDYRLQARLDAGAIAPTIRIDKVGSFSPRTLSTLDREPRQMQKH